MTGICGHVAAVIVAGALLCLAPSVAAQAPDFTDVAEIIPPGDATHADGEVKYDVAKKEYYIAGNGRTILDGEKDELFYVFRKIKGSWRIEAEVERIDRSSGSIGVMCRESINAYSKMISTTYLVTGDLMFASYRPRASRLGACALEYLPEELLGAPILCSLTRLAPLNQFVAEYYNPHTQEWLTICAPTIEMPEEVLVGLAAWSGIDDDSSWAEGYVRHVKITEFPFVVLRSLSTDVVAPGGSLDVELTVYVEAETSPNFTIAEDYPPGWKVADLDPATGDAQDDGSGTITWNATDVTGVITLGYTLIAPADASGMPSISGTFDDGAGITGKIAANELLIFSPSGQDVVSLAVNPNTGLEEIRVNVPGLPEGAKPLGMALIPAGTFIMGSPPGERGRYDNIGEGPPHEVTITRPFYFGKYQVTQAQWEAVMGSNPSVFIGEPNNPVESVSWVDCQAFIKRLNNMAFGAFRLPTEAEWEYACRAGTTTRFSFGDALECSDGTAFCDILDEHMWWGGNNVPDGPKEVGLLMPNPWGLYDMHGNLWEWCQDWYSSRYPREPQIDPQGPESGDYRVIRGGDYLNSAKECRSAIRYRDWPDIRIETMGFRLLREAEEETAVIDWPVH